MKEVTKLITIATKQLTLHRKSGDTIELSIRHVIVGPFNFVYCSEVCKVTHLRAIIDSRMMSS